MANKKIVMSVTASAAIAAALLGAEEAEASTTYKVQRGDTLWSIAQKYGTTVSHLKSVNQLTSDIIFPNQVLKTTDSSSSSSSSSSNSRGSGSSSSSSASTYTVKPGDTLSGIAARHNISLQNLMKWNNLNTTLIYPGNVFYVTDPSKGSNKSSSSSGGSSGSSGKSSTYTVKSGDSLWKIAREFGVTVANLRQWNNLKSDTIYIGQKLSIGGKASSNTGSSSSGSSNANVSYNVDKLISVAKSQMGVPYRWGGTTPSGFDCSGLIYYAYKNAGMNISRLNTEGYYNRSYHVNKPQVGDLVFFVNTYKAGISHMGIYIGNNQFIHAGTSNGVTITSLDNSYWKQRFDSFKRFY